MSEKGSAVYDNNAFHRTVSTESLTLKYIDVFKEACLSHDPPDETTNHNSELVTDDKNFEDDSPAISIVSEENNNTLFEEVVLRPTVHDSSPTTKISRAISEVPSTERPKKKLSLWKRSLSRGKRRHTTPGGIVEKEFRELNISGPSNLKIINVSETQNVPFSRGSIQDCPFDISGYGDFILTDEFTVYKPKKMVLTAFLFERIIIFTKANEDNSYYYVGNINMENVSLEPPGKSKKKLIIKDYTNSVKFQKDITFTLTALTENTQTKWRTAINRCLWSQFLRTKEQKLA